MKDFSFSVHALAASHKQSVAAEAGKSFSLGWRCHMVQPRCTCGTVERLLQDWLVVRRIKVMYPLRCISGSLSCE